MTVGTIVKAVIGIQTVLGLLAGIIIFISPLTLQQSFPTTDFNPSAFQTIGLLII